MCVLLCGLRVKKFNYECGRNPKVRLRNQPCCVITVIAPNGRQEDLIANENLPVVHQLMLALPLQFAFDYFTICERRMQISDKPFHYVVRPRRIL